MDFADLGMMQNKPHEEIPLHCPISSPFSPFPFSFSVKSDFSALIPPNITRRGA